MTKLECTSDLNKSKEKAKSCQRTSNENSSHKYMRTPNTRHMTFVEAIRASSNVWLLAVISSYNSRTALHTLVKYNEQLLVHMIAAVSGDIKKNKTRSLAEDQTSTNIGNYANLPQFQGAKL